MKIGIGCGVQPETVILSAIDAVSAVNSIADTSLEVICYAKTGTEFQFSNEELLLHGVSLDISEHPERALVDELHAKKIDAAVRGSLPANDTLKYLKHVYGVKHLARIALLETHAKQKFFFAPVGVDEGWTVDEKVLFVRDGQRLARAFGISDKAIILSGGRLGDVGRHAAVDKTICDAERAAKLSGAVHGEILIEDAVKDAGVIIAPDGISGNLIFRTLVFLGQGTGHGAPIVNIPDIFVDSSRASRGYSEVILVAEKLVSGKFM